MRELYNRTFKIGFVATIVFFAAMNLVAYFVATKLYDEMLNKPISLAPAPQFPSWGVPFSWEGSSHLFGAARGLFLNFVTIVAIAFVIGFVFRFIASRIK